MKIKKVFLSYKRSVYELYVQKHQSSKMAKLYRQKHPITQRIEGAHQRHHTTLKYVQNVLEKYGIIYESKLRGTYGQLDQYDLVITVGGDGTFLQTAHSVTNQLMLGVNSSPTDSVGAHCSVYREGFEQKLLDVMHDRFKIIKLTRLESLVNGEKLPTMALNEILLAHECPAGTTRYIIQVGRRKEEQKSSGVWIATPVGSTAVIQAAGGLSLPLASQKFSYAVREPYAPYKKYYLTKGVLAAHQKLALISKMVEGFLYMDGTHVTYPLTFGDMIEIKKAGLPLRVIQ